MKAVENKQEKVSADRAHVNLRPFLFCALGLAFGIFLYGKIRFGGFQPSDVLFVLLFCLFAIRPVSLKRTAAVFLCLILSAAVGAGAFHLRVGSYLSVREEGAYTVTGTATSVTVKSGYSVVILSDLSFDGVPAAGKCRVVLGEDVRTGDIFLLQAKIKQANPEGDLSDSYLQSLFVSDIRYTASASSSEAVGRSDNPFLRLNAALFRVLYDNLERDEASVAYALLTGNSGGMDEGLSGAMRAGGIAHIFAVSGLHIGILFSAAYLCFRPLGKYRVLPALLLAVGYSALCHFTVSSVRAVIMCGVLGAHNAFGRKYDFLESVSFAAILILLFLPAEWYSAGFRLSFGACLGLALFSGTLSRAFTRIRIPRVIGGYLAASLSVQIFTFPVLLEAFGYFPVWGVLLNLIVVPCVPVLFLGLLLCAAFALLIPPAAPFFLLFPDGMLALFLFLFSAVDFSLVFAGFSLGAGAVVWLVACVALSQRFRLPNGARAAAAVGLAVLFTVCAVAENVVFSGCRITVYGRNQSSAALVRTREQNVLVIDGDITLAECEDFLSRNFGGELDAVVVLSENETAAINVAAFLNSQTVCARTETETGLRKTAVVFGETFETGALEFRYESDTKLTLTAEDVVVEFDFEGNAALSADLFVGGSAGGLNFYLKDGIIKRK